ncbi:MAG: hypothetical protein Q9191_003293 [Dirinaria sp. TL-2023a]
MKLIFHVIVTAISVFRGDPVQASPPPVVTTTSSIQQATCLQRRASTDPAGQAISQALARSDTVSKACNASYVRFDTAKSASYYILDEDYIFNISFRVGSSGLQSTPCIIGFNTILEDCVENDSFWGGWVVNAGSNFSIINQNNPTDPLPSSAYVASGPEETAKLPLDQSVTRPDTQVAKDHTRTAPLSDGSIATSGNGFSPSSKSLLPSSITTTQSSGPALVLVTTSYNPGAVTLPTIDPSISGDTVIRTGNAEHPTGNYPFVKGGPKCFFCPPGVQGGGLVLFGMQNPGIYPPPTPPPFPHIKNFPTISIGSNIIPTPAEEEPTSGSTTSATSKPTTSVEPSEQEPSTANPSSAQPSSVESSSLESTTAVPSTTITTPSSSSCGVSTIASDCSLICSSASSRDREHNYIVLAPF